LFSPRIWGGFEFCFLGVVCVLGGLGVWGLGGTRLLVRLFSLTLTNEGTLSVDYSVRLESNRDQEHSFSTRQYCAR